jgi:thioesterase DpgC
LIVEPRRAARRSFFVTLSRRRMAMMDGMKGGSLLAELEQDRPDMTGSLAGDASELARYCELGPRLLAGAGDHGERAGVHEALRRARRDFLRRHVEGVYAALTDGYRRTVRVEDLVFLAADHFPGLVPTREMIAAEREHKQADKEGFEIDQGLFLSAVLDARRPGLHLIHSMLRPKDESRKRLNELVRAGEVDLGHARVERRGATGVLELHNQRFLNAEDDEAAEALEMGADLVLLDPSIEVGVLRGSVVQHPRHAGLRVFNSGINLTHLYYGRISFVNFFIARELGLVAKLQRGLWMAEQTEEGPELTEEKPWVAAVERHAIGGGCQLLLVMDRVLAEPGVRFTLPARKEGIIPGAANLRLPRFLGDRGARQAIFFERGFTAGEPDGALLCDRVVGAGMMDEAISETAAQLTSAGVVSAVANRKALRVCQEPIDDFRKYMALYSREQALCLYSPALIRNLEEGWRAHERSL